MAQKPPGETKVLVVDDEEAMRDLFSRVLKVKGYQVITVESGYEAMDTLEKESVDVAFIDVKMAGMDGLDTYKALRKSDPNLKAIMMTGFAVEDKIKKAIELGAQGSLLKPFDITEILTILQKVLEVK